MKMDVFSNYQITQETFEEKWVPLAEDFFKK